MRRSKRRRRPEATQMAARHTSTVAVSSRLSPFWQRRATRICVRSWQEEKRVRETRGSERAGAVHRERKSRRNASETKGALHSLDILSNIAVSNPPLSYPLPLHLSAFHPPIHPRPSQTLHPLIFHPLFRPPCSLVATHHGRAPRVDGAPVEIQPREPVAQRRTLLRQRSLSLRLLALARIPQTSVSICEKKCRMAAKCALCSTRV